MEKKSQRAPKIRVDLKRLSLLAGGVLVSILLVLAAEYVEGNDVIKFTTRYRLSDVEFDGDRIVFHMPPDTFLSLPHERRAARIALYVSAVVDRVRATAGGRDIIDVANSLVFEANRTVRIRPAVREVLGGAFEWNYAFTTHVRYPDSQKRFIHKMVAYMNESAGRTLRYDEYLRKMTGFSDTGFLRAAVTDGPRWYIERSMILHDIARTVIGPEKAPGIQHLADLTEWTFINVSNHFVRRLPGHEDFADYNDIPLELLIRGMGSCDRSAWVLSKLAYHAGLESNIVYLHRPGQEGKSSFHTVAEIRTPEGWRAVDPFNNILYEKGVVELSRDTEYFRNCWIFPNHASPHAFLPVMKIAEGICRFYVPDQRLFFDIHETVSRYVADHFPDARLEAVARILENMCGGYAVRLDPDPVALTRWELPFWLRGYYFQKAYQDYKYAKLPFLKKIRDARIEQLLGHYRAADRKFAHLKQYENGDILFNEERGYFHTLNSYFNRDYTAVIRDARQYMTRYQDSPRNAMLKYVMAQSLIKLDRPGEAALIYPAGKNFESRGRILTAGP